MENLVLFNLCDFMLHNDSRKCTYMIAILRDAIDKRKAKLLLVISD